MRVSTSRPPAHRSTPATLNAKKTKLTERQEAAFGRLVRHLAFVRWLIAYDVWWSAEHVTRWGAPAPVSSMRCPSGSVASEIDWVFGIAAPWAESIAWRESNCEPGARNPSGSAGVFQLLGHDDLLAAACPDVVPSASWAIADCNIRAAFALFDEEGIAPWRL